MVLVQMGVKPVLADARRIAVDAQRHVLTLGEKLAAASGLHQLRPQVNDRRLDRFALFQFRRGGIGHGFLPLIFA